MGAINGRSPVDGDDSSADHRTDAGRLFVCGDGRSSGHYGKQCSRAREPGQKSAEVRTGSEAMIEDRELNSWREQWKLVAPVSPEFQHKIQLSIRQQNRRFVLGNVLTAIVLIAILIFAVALRHQESWLGA